MRKEDNNVDEDNSVEEIRKVKIIRTFGKRRKEEELDDGKNTKPSRDDPTATVEPDEPFVCAWEGCRKKFKLMSRLHIHIKRSHKKSTRVRCPWPGCTQRYKTGYLLTRHYRVEHHAKLPFVCDECGKDVINQESLEQHIDLHHQKAYVCSWIGCKKSFNTPSERVLHEKFHENDSIECPWEDCIWTFKRASDLPKHIHDRHTHISTQEHCTSSFASSEEIAEPTAEHNNLTSRVEDELAFLKCDFNYCTRSFSTTFRLTMHQKLHTGDEPFVCSFCGRKYATEILICSHLSENWNICGVEYGDCIPSSIITEPNQENLHLEKFDIMDNDETVAEPFGCTFTLCTKTFASTLGLSYHAVIHTGERPFVCSECTNSYRHEKSLRYHLEQSWQKCGASYPSGILCPLFDESEDELEAYESPSAAASLCNEKDPIKIECCSPTH